MTTLGIDIGGTAVKAALLSGGSVRTGISGEYARPDRETLRAAIGHAVRDVIGDTAGVPIERVGLCVPGRRASDGASIELAVNVPGLVGYRFDDLVGDALGRPAGVVLLGDAEAATLDVVRGLRTEERVLGVAVGTGVGVALVERGRSLGIGGGGLGHLGQIDVGPIGDGITPGDRVGADGGRNSLESYLGLPALRARFGDALSEGIASMSDRDPALIALSRAIRIALALYTPRRVVLLGGIGMALGRHASRIDALVRDGLTSVATEGWGLGFGCSRHHAACGAAQAASAS